MLTLAALPLLWKALARLAALLGYPYPHDGLEGTLLHEARLLRAGEPLYQPLEQLRFVSAPYPPLHPLLLALADRFAGPHVFWSGRLISLIATLCIAALIVLTARRAGGAWLGGLIGAALLLSAPPVLLWATRIKPDMLALLLTALGLYLATRAIDDPRRSIAWRWPVVAGCFVLAFFTKQTAIAAPLACGLALLIADVRAFERATPPSLRARAGYVGRLPIRRRTLVFGLTYAALALGIWALLDGVTGFQYSAHVWGLHRSEWRSTALLLKFVELLAPYWPAVLLAAALVARALRTGRALVPACYALVAPLTLLGASETGANHNHLLETLLALALLAGCAAGWMAELLDRRSLAALLLLGLLGGQIALAYQPQQWYLGELAPDDPPARYLTYLRAVPGEVLADDVGLLFAAGRPLRYDDPSTMGPAARSGVWDQSGLLREIAERRFSAILLPLNIERETSDPSGRWTDEMLAAIRAHYRLEFRDTIFTYVPK